MSGNPSAKNQPAVSKAAASVVSLGGGALLGRAVAFIGTAYLARVLGPAAFGIIGFALAITTYFRLAVDGGFNPVGARAIAQSPERAASMAASIIVFRLILAAGAMLFLAVVAAFLPKPLVTKIVLVLMGLEFVGLAVDTSWVYKGLERNRPVGIALIITEVVSVAALFAFVRSEDDIVMVPLAVLSGQLVAATYLAWPLFSRASENVVVRIRDGADLFKQSSYLIVSKIMRVLFFSFDVLLLSLLVGDVEVGLYTAAYRVCFVVTALAGAVAFSYLPEFARGAAESAPLSPIADRSFQLSSTIVFPLVVGGVILAKPLLTSLFGDEYEGATVAFQLLLVSVGLAFLRATPINVILVRNRLRLDMTIVVAATMLNVVLNLILIPEYGLEGAAFATLIAEGVYFSGALVAGHSLGATFRFTPFLRSFAATATMGGLLLIVGTSLHVFLRVGVGAIAFLGMLVLINGIPEDARGPVDALMSRLRAFRNA